MPNNAFVSYRSLFVINSAFYITYRTRILSSLNHPRYSMRGGPICSSSIFVCHENSVACRVSGSHGGPGHGGRRLDRRATRFGLHGAIRTSSWWTPGGIQGHGTTGPARGNDSRRRAHLLARTPGRERGLPAGLGTAPAPGVPSTAPYRRDSPP